MSGEKTPDRLMDQLRREYPDLMSMIGNIENWGIEEAVNDGYVRPEYVPDSMPELKEKVEDLVKAMEVVSEISEEVIGKLRDFQRSKGVPESWIH